MQTILLGPTREVPAATRAGDTEIASAGCAETSATFLPGYRLASPQERNEHGNLLNPGSDPNVQSLSLLME